MSDALNDIRRDEERHELLGRVRRLEREFLKAPDRERARNLEKLWMAYVRMRHGYWGGPNEALAYERIAWYHDWRPEIGTEWLARFYVEGVAVRTGAGFLVDTEVFEDAFGRALLEKGQGPFSHSVFRVKVRMEVERVTCRDCLQFNRTCGTVVCESRVDGELAERKRLAALGRALVESSEQAASAEGWGRTGRTPVPPPPKVREVQRDGGQADGRADPATEGQGQSR